MKKILFITTTPTAGGNGDTLISAALKEAEKNGAETVRVDIRKKKIEICNVCNQCRDTGTCIKKDDFNDILALAHDCDGIIMEAPIYYNCMAAQAIVLIDRLYCTYGSPYKLGKKKKVGVFLTCTGSDEKEMEHHVELILNLESIQRSVSEYKVDIFTNCISPTTSLESEEYLKRAQEMGKWLSE